MARDERKAFMDCTLNAIRTIESGFSELIASDPALKETFGENFDPIVRLADPKFGDFQANGVLGIAKKKQLNPVVLANELCDQLTAEPYLNPDFFALSVAGPGFINIRAKRAYLSKWLASYAKPEQIADAFSTQLSSTTIVIDFPSANTAKRAHIGHLRPMVIGEAIARMLEFSGANLVRDNHIGDWGTNFGTLIMILKRKGLDIHELNNPAEALELIDQLYKEGSLLEKAHPELREQSRHELLKLQRGDSVNTSLWQSIINISNQAFDHLFKQLGVRTDVTLGESFYKDKVERVYDELLDSKIAEESDGALVVWHDSVKKFARDNPRPFPFNIRKKDGASNYASTDLATVLYRIEHFKAQSVIYLTDARQQDHFEQLFLTTEKWFEAKGYPIPKLKHVWWGTILGLDNKPIKTKSGESIKLQALIDEACERALKVVVEKNPDLSEAEQARIAQAVGIGALKYADLSSNRTQDYVFDWDRMLSFEGNTAPYLLYVVARINSIFRKAGFDPKVESFSGSHIIETEQERLLARKLIQFPISLEQSLSDLRPHFLATYLYELAGTYNVFYSHEKVIHEDPSVQHRRLMLCHRTHLILSTGLEILGINRVERM